MGVSFRQGRSEADGRGQADVRRSIYLQTGGEEMKRSRTKLGILLRVIREAKRLKQEEVARKMFVDRNTVSRIENGVQEPTAEQIIRFVDACGGVKFLDWIAESMYRLREIIESDGDEFNRIKFA
jgi:DNA-binding XRE family transcriptional regulator